MAAKTGAYMGGIRTLEDLRIRLWGVSVSRIACAARQDLGSGIGRQQCLFFGWCL